MNGSATNSAYTSDTSEACRTGIIFFPCGRLDMMDGDLKTDIDQIPTNIFFFIRKNTNRDNMSKLIKIKYM